MEPLAVDTIPAVIDDPVQEIRDFDGVVERYWLRVHRFLLASVQDLDTAQTLTQDCFWKAYKNRAAFRGEASLITWLMHIAVNLVRDHARNQRLRFWRNVGRSAVEAREIRDWLPDRSLSPEERASLNERIRSVWNATKNLSERQRSVFVLRFVEDLDIAEIAQATGLTENAVNVHLFRAIRSVRKRLQETP